MVKPDITLLHLARKLDYVLRSGEHSQKSIASRAKIDQSLVSRVVNGHVTRLTKRIIRLEGVVRDIYANMQKNFPDTPAAVGAAVTGYLAAGGDPELLVEQVDVLRRAVSPTRRSEA